MERKALADKIMMIGIDGMDPRLTRKYVDEGKMPNVAKLIEKGACRQDLAMVGAMPTVTPPMWTTLATGAYPGTHGITCFFRATKEPDKIAYNFDSRLCKAEQLWNVFAEAGRKTLVWHWPGSAWPPSSDSPNLYVVDGTSPGVPTSSVCKVDTELLVGAAEQIKEVTFVPKAPIEASAACVVEDLDVEENTAGGLADKLKVNAQGSRKSMIYKESQLTSQSTEAFIDMARSPIKEANGWALAPTDAKEFTILLSGGLIRRPALILKNDDGVYDTVAVYKRKRYRADGRSSIGKNGCECSR